MLKKIGIGLLVLFGIIIVIIIIVAVIGGGGESSTTSSDSGESAPTPPPLINAMTVWREYESNETRANQLYKQGWLTVQLDNITKIESGGDVRMDVDSFGFNYISLDFKNDNDVLDLNPGQSITAVCKLSGFQLDSWLNFKDCRFP